MFVLSWVSGTFKTIGIWSKRLERSVPINDRGGSSPIGLARKTLALSLDLDKQTAQRQPLRDALCFGAWKSAHHFWFSISVFSISKIPWWSFRCFIDWIVIYPAGQELVLPFKKRVMRIISCSPYPRPDLKVSFSYRGVTCSGQNCWNQLSSVVSCTLICTLLHGVVLPFNGTS